jgi:dynein heavy chain
LAFLKETILLLKKNNVDQKGEDYLAIMETRQANFKEIFQNVINIKSNILGLQLQETDALKSRIVDFTEKVKEFRQTFLAEAPFSYDIKASVAEIDTSYDILDDYYFKLEDIKAEAKRFNDLENLFELELTKYKLLTECRNDLEKLKYMWDLIALINNSYADWMSTPWKSIDVEANQVENDAFISVISKARDIKSLKGSPVIAEKCANMKKILNCIASLNTDAMEPRHWNTLSSEVGSKIEHTVPTFCFEDIVKVNIHKYEPQVQELAEVALKEGKIGKDLLRIENTWQKLAFEFEPYAQGGGEMKIFKPFDIIQETLDADTVKILGLLSQGKSVEFFRERLDTMRSQLNNIDNTINVWGKVQKNWKRLVNIF